MALVDKDRARRPQPREQLAGHRVADPETSRALLALERAIHRVEARFDDLKILTGDGDPEGVIDAPIGTLWLRRDAEDGPKLYVKESGAGTAGWVSK